jgi:hypothetical protein
MVDKISSIIDPDLAFTVSVAHYFVIGCAVFSIFWGVVNALMVKSVKMDNEEDWQHVERVVAEESEMSGTAIGDGEDEQWPAKKIMEELKFISTKITEGADSFLIQEYLYLGIFSICFAVLLGFTVDNEEMSRGTNPEEFEPATNFPYTAVSFLVGCLTSIAAGYIGMKIAVYTNSRTTFGCCERTHVGFLAAFRGGQVLGFVLVGLALFVLELVIITF